MRWGRGKTSMETELLQCRDRALDGSNFQDLGIKARVKATIPQYDSSKDFLNEGETSDEDPHLNHQHAGGEGNEIHEVAESEDEQDFNNVTVGLMGRGKSRFR